MYRFLPAQTKAFMQPNANEEMIDQPLYHFQSYGTSGATSFTFFQTTIGSATNGLSDTNMEQAGALSLGKKMAVLSVSVHFIPSAPQVNNAGASTASALNDIKKVIEGVGALQLTILNKPYLQVAPLSALPAGQGIYTSGASYQATQASGAAGDGFIAYGTNGMPLPSARYQLCTPLPIPSQVSFNVVITFPTAITVTTASRIGVYLWGPQIRAMQ